MFKYVLSILLFIIVLQPTLISADDHEDLISGVINAISIDDNGNVEGILLMMNNGDFMNIDIKSGDNPTEFGLETVSYTHLRAHETRH